MLNSERRILPRRFSTAQTGLTYTATLAASTTYFWQVISNGNGVTMAGPIWTFTTGTGNAPIAPSNATVTNATTTTLQVNWTDNATNETGFPIYGNALGDPLALIGTAEANATSYTHTGLTPGQQYSYRVFAIQCRGTIDELGECIGLDGSGSCRCAIRLACWSRVLRYHVYRYWRRCE